MAVVDYVSDLNVKLRLCLDDFIDCEAVQNGCVGDASHKAV